MDKGKKGKKEKKVKKEEKKEKKVKNRYMFSYIFDLRRIRFGSF